ncbi:hypothetical protein FAVG1_04119 [Fusarium avenaceum]|nr:hypothetical protein FAVG1_04119 [Fusarium avenaceum]
MALSYTWGMPDASRGMSIDGSSLVITPNLEHALRHLRSAETAQRLWVDFICINQSDYQERSTQVSLMTKIYSWGKLVPCWLGDSTPDSTIGMEILSYLAGDLPFDEGSPWNRHSMQKTTEGLRDVLGRSYFSRIWVVQEAALASCVKVQVGDLFITWEREKSARLFLARIKLLEVSPSWRSTGGSKVDMRPIRELLEQSILQIDRQVGRVQNATLLDAVHSMRFREFTNPMDSIYGIMGLVSPAEVAGLVPDYSQSWEETYNQFYEHALRNVLKNPEEKWEVKSDSLTA